MTKNIVIALLIALSVSLGLFALWPGPSVAKGCSGKMVVTSFYGLETCRPGKKCQTANEELFNGKSLTAAHKTLPFNTKLRVTFKGKSVTVRVNDRGPWTKGRTLDLSRAAAVRIGLVNVGVAKVCMERL